MASELPNSSEPSPFLYEFDGLELTEFDSITLQELLQDEEPEDNVQDNSSSGISQSMETVNGDLDSMAMEYSDKIQFHYDNFAWIDTMEIGSALPSIDMDLWYVDNAHTEEIISGIAQVKEVIDTSDSTIQIDESSYFELWHDN